MLNLCYHFHIQLIIMIILREYIEEDIVQFAKENPHVALYLKPRRNRSPVIVAEYCKYDLLFNTVIVTFPRLL